MITNRTRQKDPWKTGLVLLVLYLGVSVALALTVEYFYF